MERQSNRGAGGPWAPCALWLLAAAAVAWASWRAYAAWWTADDAFISFRYARNLVEGLGLVFNAGERVEGYTNFLWTLWTAAGLWSGYGAEDWANFWGLAAYSGSILLLAANSQLRRPHGGWVLPLAALGAALHGDWRIYATSGLETSMFTFLLLAGTLLVAWNLDRPVALGGAGILFALAGLTRPDGVLPAAVAALFVLAFARPRGKCAASFGLGFVVVWLPATLWRMNYYRSFFPNTYYAKSAYLAWYGQGWRYLVLYYGKYWLLLTGPLLLLAALAMERLRGGRGTAPGAALQWRQALLAAAILASYTFYIVRVGGDFMFARMLVPTAPFLLLLFELGWTAAFRTRPVWGCCLALAALAGVQLTPHPLPGSQLRYGVANEWLYYSKERVAGLDHSAEVLGRTFASLPVRVAFYGDEARIVYKARFPVAIESHAGLTEPEVAHQELDRRRRVGHEKHASARYLIEQRKAHFTFSGVPRQLIGLNQEIPEVLVRFDPDVWGQVLHWDPELMAALAGRGVPIPDFPSYLQGYVDRLDQLPTEEVEDAFRKFRLFYFDHVQDPEREAAFRRRLAAGTAQARP